MREIHIEKLSLKILKYVGRQIKNWNIELFKYNLSHRVNNNKYLDNKEYIKAF